MANSRCASVWVRRTPRCGTWRRHGGESRKKQRKRKHLIGYLGAIFEGSSAPGKGASKDARRPTTLFMDVLKKLFEQHFHSPVEREQPLQGELGGSGRNIIRLSNKKTSAI